MLGVSSTNPITNVVVFKQIIQTWLLYVDFQTIQHNFPCLNVYPKYITGVNFEKICSINESVELFKRRISEINNFGLRGFQNEYLKEKL